jgi:type IV secretory pathway TraG/TraD family ATPase VirD4
MTAPSPTPALDDLRRHLAACGGRLYVGTGDGGLALADPQHAVLVLGPPRSGKTTTLAIPNVLAAPGAVVATSTKLDVLAATAAARIGLGRCWVFDPSASVAVPDGMARLRWSPVAAATTWDESLLLARAMAGAARPLNRSGEIAHWTERAEALLAPLLHAAHLSGAGMTAVVRWVHRQELGPAQATLATHGVDTASDVLAGIEATDPREQSGIWSSAAGVIAAYRSDAVLDSGEAPNFDPRALVASGDTVYICAPARHQALAAPIVVAFLEQVRAGAYEAWARGQVRAPVTLVLDELANIAPIPDLPAMVSEGGGQGLLTLACLQDLSQARQRWGPAADGFLSLFGTKVVLPGLGDLATLELVSRLGGEVDVPARSVTRNQWAWGAPTVTWSTHRQRRLPVDVVSHQPPGTALVLGGPRPPAMVGLPPWWVVPTFHIPYAAPAAWLRPGGATGRALDPPGLGRGLR